MGLAAPLVGAAFVLSGCWATSHSNIFEDNLTVSQDATAKTILVCTQQHPNDANARAACALDVVKLSCHLQPVPGFPVGECDYATDHRYIPDMRDSIQAILDNAPVPGGGKWACLFYVDPHYVGVDAWYPDPLGEPGCPN